MSENKYVCSVCIEALIAPVTFGCGHSTCSACYESLKHTGGGVGVLNCPECRTGISRECKINIVLDQVFSCIIPDYEILKTKMTEEIQRTTLFKRYKHSKRYNKIAGILRQKMKKEGYLTSTDMTSLDFSVSPAPIYDEIIYIIQTGGVQVLDINLKDVTYYVSRSDLYESHMTNFAEAHKDELTPEHLYRIVSAMDSEVEMFFDKLNLLPHKDLVWDNEKLSEFLINVDFTNIIINKNDISNQSDGSESSDSDSSVSDMNDSSDSDSDNTDIESD